MFRFDRWLSTVSPYYFVAAALANGCSSLAPAQCASSTQCDFQAGGLCKKSPSGHAWCQYPDATCPGGVRWSTEAGDDLQSVCVTAHSVTVALTGTGHGQVTSTSAGIACGTQCEALIADGASIDLTAEPDEASRFGRWQGDAGVCGATLRCTLPVSSATQVIASFDRIPDFTLTISKAGNGSGTVSSEASAEINCGAKCSAIFREGAMVTIDAQPAPGSLFLGWSGLSECPSLGPCRFQLTSDTQVAARFEKYGTALWLAAGGGARDDYGKFIGSDNSGNVYLSGTFFSPMMQIGAFTLFNNDTSAGSFGTPDVFVAKLSPDGRVLWARDLGGPSFEDVAGMAVRPDGDVIVSGTFDTSIALDDQHILVGDGETDLFIARLSAESGQVRWAKKAKNPDVQAFSRLPVANSPGGDVFLAGTMYNSITFDDRPPVLAKSASDHFVYRLSGETGDVVWLSLPDYVDPAHDAGRIYNIAVNHAGNVVALGQCLGGIRFGEGPLVSTVTCSDGTTAGQGFVAVLDGATGDGVRSRSFGVTGIESCFGLAISEYDDVIVGCDFVGGNGVVVDFGGGPLPAAPGAFGDDIVIAKYDPNLEYAWAKYIGGSQIDHLGGIGYQRGESSRVAVVASFAETLVLDGRTFTSLEGSDSLVATFALGDGQLAWAEQFNTPLEEPLGGSLVFVDEHTNQLLLTGVFTYSLDLGFKNITSSDSRTPDAFVARLLLPP